MLLNIQQAQLNEGKLIKIDVNVVVDNDVLSFRGYTFAGPVELVGTICYEFDSLKLQAQAKTNINAVCDACGESFVYSLKFDVDETFTKDASEFNNYYQLGSDCVDISKPLIDNLLVNLPSKMMCKVNCKGLCKYCGKNKNYYECNCEEIQKELIEQENPFYKLKNLDKNIRGE